MGIFQVGEKEAFQNLNSRTEEGDGSVRAAGVCGFAGLEEGNDFGGCPNGGDDGLLDREVENGGEEGFAVLVCISAVILNGLNCVNMPKLLFQGDIIIGVVSMK